MVMMSLHRSVSWQAPMIPRPHLTISKPPTMTITVCLTMPAMSNPLWVQIPGQVFLQVVTHLCHQVAFHQWPITKNTNLNNIIYNNNI